MYATSCGQQAGLDPKLYHARQLLVEKVRNEEAEEDQQFVSSVHVEFEKEEDSILGKMPQTVKYLLVSSPEYDLARMPVFQVALAMAGLLGGSNAAGDAKDRFHKTVMTKSEMEVAVQGRRTAWKGKVCQAIKLLNQFSPGHTLVLLMIDGGPECQFEQQEVRGPMASSFPDVQKQIRRFSSFDDFEAYGTSSQARL